MTTKEFIHQKLNELVDSNPEIQLRYENHEQSHTHFVEVLPLDFYKRNAAFRDWEEKIVFEFLDLFPDQHLSFISEEAILGIEKCELTLKGANYGKKRQKSFSENVTLIKSRDLNELNGFYNSLIKDSYSIDFNCIDKEFSGKHILPATFSKRFLFENEIVLNDINFFFNTPSSYIEIIENPNFVSTEISVVKISDILNSEIESSISYQEKDLLADESNYALAA